MASVSDMYSGNAKSSSLPTDWVRGAISESEAASDAGLQQSRLLREHRTRSLPDLVNRFASRVEGWSGNLIRPRSIEATVI